MEKTILLMNCESLSITISRRTTLNKSRRTTLSGLTTFRIHQPLAATYYCYEWLLWFMSHWYSTFQTRSAASFAIKRSP